MSSRTESEKGSERDASLTAARTRPLSIQEILLRREKKAAAEAKKTKELQGNDTSKPNHLESGRGHKSRKELKDASVEGSKKESIRDTPREDQNKDDVRRTSKEGSKKENMRYAPKEVSKKENLKDRRKDGSKMDDLKDTPKVTRKDDQRDAPKKGSKKLKSTIRNDSQSAGKDEVTHGSQKTSTSMRGLADESKDANHGRTRARNAHTIGYESLKGPGKRWNGETVDNDRIKEKSEKPRNETKRKFHGFDDQIEKSQDLDRPVLKKHDFARFRDSRHSDRNDGRKEYGKPYDEEPRSKRRRSRSRDHDRERRDRSVSLSPREQRRSYRGHDHDNYPPGRKYAETDRFRTSGNGGHNDGSYRRYESRLGGYSPRKRKTAPQDEQMTAKTSFPVVRSPERKSATWDQGPAKADQSNFFTSLQPIVSQMTSSVSVSSSAPKQNSATTLETILSGNSSSIDSVQLTQATRPLRRLHIENLPSSASEDMLIGCLNDFFLSSDVNHIQKSKQPCLSCTINKEKHQAFVEFLTPEDATAALSFDGRSFNGSALKIRRPKEYIEMANVVPKKTVEEIKLASDVADSPHKIFVAGISGVISSEMLMEIVSSFGQLAAYRFQDHEALSGRCAFLEYIDHSITDKACAGLNGMKLGGCILTAVQVFPNPLEACNEASPFYSIPDSAKMLLEAPTEVLQLKNVFDREEYLLLSKSELEEIMEDIRMECARFGAVKSINIVEYPASSDSTLQDIIVEPKDGPVKLEPTEHCAEIVTECSSPTADPALDQHMEADHMDSKQAVHMDSTQADHHATTVDDDSAVGHAGPRTLEICSSTTPGDVVDTSERENQQQGTNDVSESGAEQLPEAGTRDDALVSGTIMLEAGSILVEFMRKEAACMAAHSLHGRSFGDRSLSAGYAPHDLYLQMYPR
ncbi:splicing factor U2af large subunit B isoform X2 [Brachypodium distachyon]|uniref:RRM domain-containing protein n=1 Tax=Brachypodium distachyon TaxID=15368 RepID=A0A0Q3HLD9_BRADI|nr:splicing factor U2af large subunit B isoform X2 [Brachypodium distachyon]KQK23751.1 hypothetical protein BRADI_1g75860v3 [Brachypodium distachyon]|eukprot:XP_024313431.1 splicing factor U2af large subunit B isoform X2 [Brachypodium distachyon]